MKILAAGMLILLGLSVGLLQSMQLRNRVQELETFQSAIISMKSTAAYTAGDLQVLLTLCQGNAFIDRIACGGDPIESWKKAAANYFTYGADRVLADNLISGFGRTDLQGLLSYMTLYEQRVDSALKEARQSVVSKCRLYTMLGLFSGTAAALILC